MRKMEPLDNYHQRPKELDEYIAYNGWHFNKKSCDFAVSLMRKMNPATGKKERIEPWTKEQVDEMLKKNNVKLENNVGYDYVYVANQCKADLLKESVPDEAHAAKYVKNIIDDVDQADGFIFNRFYADCNRNGMPIPWSDVL